MTESIINNIQVKIQVGCYGSFLCELPDLSAARREDVYCGDTCLGSSGANPNNFADYYPTISKHHTPAAAMRAFAERLDFIFGPRQLEAMQAWQTGKFLGYEGGEQWIREYGTPEAIERLDKKQGLAVIPLETKT